ncbi:hypothetical protein GA0070624_5820 [Micromonospora rhizosphaerae]|uniref:Uncharacterized protein n=1 Tax=Micromonospora rhizosphaerae TaxID=568872 RepID=A0A1C6T649_9ACTN|nr:hypothetical protein [Micromonospora rhizosphaerae]SCL37286.1 hypothetical protein GA0070624_5820 [Micromonospora rhizosphaerae]
MGRLATAYAEVVAAHRQAVARWENARRALAAAGPPAPSDAEMVADLARLGADLARLAADLAAPAAGAAGVTAAPVPVRIGEATTLDGGFPVLLPLAGGTHLAVDADARDPRVGELLRSVVLRLLATAPAGAVRVAGIDTMAFGAAFLPLRPLLDAGVLAPPATTAAEVATLLDEAERHADRDDQELLLLVAASALPPRELARLAALTHAGSAAAVCVLLAGYPPAGPGDASPPLGAATQLRLNERYALVGDPPGQPFSTDGSGLAAPVLLDGGPPPRTVTELARRLGGATRPTDAVCRTDLLAERRWAEPAGPRPVTAFEEYAALARQLSARQCGGEQAAAEAERQRAVHAATDRLGHRLAAQGRRLDRLSRAIGATPPAPVAVPSPPPAAPVVASSATPVAVPSPPPDVPVGASAAAPVPSPLAGAPVVASAVAPVVASAAPVVPGGSIVATAVLPGPRSAEVDPAAELAAARQLADEADRQGQRAEAVARRPALLPSWSPLARAVAVYTGCALAGAVLVLLLAVASEFQAIGLGAVLAGTCTGVPVASFLAGHLVLRRWGRPVIGAGTPPSRFVPLGFVLCALLSPSLYCAYVLLFRLLR